MNSQYAAGQSAMQDRAQRAAGEAAHRHEGHDGYSRAKDGAAADQVRACVDAIGALDVVAEAGEVHKNAIIGSATITNDDHGVLSAWLHLDYGGSGQGFGGYALYLPTSFRHAKNQQNLAGHFIWRVMEIAAVTEWAQLRGRTIRVRSTHCGIEAIGHIVKDDWFCPRDDFKAMEDAATKVAGVTTLRKVSDD